MVGMKADTPGSRDTRFAVTETTVSKIITRPEALFEVSSCLWLLRENGKFREDSCLFVNHYNRRSSTQKMLGCFLMNSLYARPKSEECYSVSRVL